MKRTYRRARKSYKKRSFKKRYTRKGGFKYKGKADGGYLEKIIKTAYLIVDQTGTYASHAVHWIATGVSGNDDTYHTGGGPGNIDAQFDQCRRMFKEYKISSYKLDYRPYEIDAGNAGSYSRSPISVSTYMDYNPAAGGPT